MSRIEELILSLPIELQDQVEAYVRHLIEEQAHSPTHPLALEWKGALRDIRDQFESVGLQHKSAEWWGR